MDGYVEQSRTVYDYQVKGRFGYRNNSGAPFSYLNFPGSNIPLGQYTKSYRGSSDRDDPRFELSDALGEAKQLGTQFDSSRRFVSRFDNGHEFVTERKFLNMSHSHVDYSGPFYTFHGPLMFVPGNSPDNNDTGNNLVNKSFPQVEQVSPNDLFKLGPKFISDTVPTKSVASLAQFLGELREGLPKLMGLSILSGKDAKSIADEYLNYQFGIKPFVNDLKKFAKAARESSRILKQYERDSGRVVRRSTGVPRVVESTEAVKLEYQPYSWGSAENGYKLHYASQAFAQGEFTAPGEAIRKEGGTTYPFFDVYRQTQTQKSIWFKGAYSYYLNDGNDVISKLKRYEQLANKLLGTRITWDLIYQLTPWSWLLDWFVDIGNIITSTTALQQDGLVMRYGYIMCTTRSSVQYYTTGFQLNSSSPRSMVSTTYSSVRKSRVRATPYGFGLNPDSFSNQQWAILGALGMTKGPGNLRIR